MRAKCSIYYIFLNAVIILVLFFFVAVPTATILGGPDLYVDIGSTINLTCAIKHSPEPPTHIFWYHQDKVSSWFSLELFISPFHIIYFVVHSIYFITFWQSGIEFILIAILFFKLILFVLTFI